MKRINFKCYVKSSQFILMSYFLKEPVKVSFLLSHVKFMLIILLKWHLI